jgi:hypothetical protein
VSLGVWFGIVRLAAHLRHRRSAGLCTNLGEVRRLCFDVTRLSHGPGDETGRLLEKLPDPGRHLLARSVFPTRLRPSERTARMTRMCASRHKPTCTSDTERPPCAVPGVISRCAAACLKLLLGAQGDWAFQLKVGEPAADEVTTGVRSLECLVGPEPFLRAPVADLVEKGDAKVVVRRDGAEETLVGRKRPVRLQRVVQCPALRGRERVAPRSCEASRNEIFSRHRSCCDCLN